MTIEEAEKQFHSEMNGKDWYYTTQIKEKDGVPSIYVYIKCHPSKEQMREMKVVSQKYAPHPIEVRVMCEEKRKRLEKP